MPHDLDAKIERLFGLIQEELKTLRELVTLKFGGHEDRILDLEHGHRDTQQRLAALEARPTQARKKARR